VSGRTPGSRDRGRWAESGAQRFPDTCAHHGRAMAGLLAIFPEFEREVQKWVSLTPLRTPAEKLTMHCETSVFGCVLRCGEFF